MASFDAARLERAFALLASGVEQGAYAGAVAAVGGRDGLVALRATGMGAVEPQSVPMKVETRFDLASLTKVVATLPAVLRLLEEGAFVLETPVTQILPEFGDGRVTVRHLLTHTAGLPAWLPLYLDHQGWEAYTQAICQTGLERDPGTAVVYSDLGFILLGAMVQRVTGRSLPDFCREAVFEPLGMQATGWLPTLPREAMAATERGNQVEYGMCGGRAASYAGWRQGMIWGEVNDGNAFYGLGGVSSHAGLFSTAQDLVAYAEAWLNQGASLLGPQTVRLATRCHTPGLGDSRGLGWQKPPAVPFPNGRSSCGDMFTPAAFGHTGFTGTSLWIDPELGIYIILLTNRLHPAPSDRFYAVRPAFHNAVLASLR